MAKLTILKNPEQAKANNTTVRESFRVSPDTLTQRPPFQGLYQIDPGVLERITSHMRANGYDNGQPITVWRHELENGEEERVVVDGHTRLRAARDAGLLEVTVIYRSFASDAEALKYAIHNQRDRRNLSDAEIIGLVVMVDKPVTGFKGALPIAIAGTNAAKAARTSYLTASAIGVGRGKVEEARTVLSDPEVKEKVKAGGISIHAGAREVKAKRRGNALKRAQRSVTREKMKNLSIITYGQAVQMIALHDHPEEADLKMFVSIQLAAYFYEEDAGKVIRDVLRYRNSHRKK